MNLFPLIKKFNDVKDLKTSVFLKEESTFHGKSFRSGTYFKILGYRTIGDSDYLVLSKGTWEGLVSYDEVYKFDSNEKLV